MLAIFVILLTAHVTQQYKGNSTLYFHGNNGYVNKPQCYIISIHTHVSCDCNGWYSRTHWSCSCNFMEEWNKVLLAKPTVT